MSASPTGWTRTAALLRTGAGLALLAAGQLTGWIALLFAAWPWYAGGNSYQSGRVGTIGERLFPAFWLLAAIGTALMAGWFARRDGRPARPAVTAAVLVTAAIGAANYVTDWRLLALPLHPLSNLLGEATFMVVASGELAPGLLVLSRRPSVR